MLADIDQPNCLTMLQCIPGYSRARYSVLTLTDWVSRSPVIEGVGRCTAAVTTLAPSTLNGFGDGGASKGDASLDASESAAKAKRMAASGLPASMRMVDDARK